MWEINLSGKKLKTFNINLVYSFVMKHKSDDYEFKYNYITLSKADFLKTFLTVSRNYNKYMDLEIGLISKEAKLLWEKITKQ